VPKAFVLVVLHIAFVVVRSFRRPLKAEADKDRPLARSPDKHAALTQTPTAAATTVRPRVPGTSCWCVRPLRLAAPTDMDGWDVASDATAIARTRAEESDRCPIPNPN
jgi:hypothetical protein